MTPPQGRIPNRLGHNFPACTTSLLKHCSAVLILLFLCNMAPCYAESKALEEAAQNTNNDFTSFDAIILGLVEGITEYLPISSTGHLVLTNRFLGLDSAGPELQAAANAYAIVIQGGAILAVLFLYWKRVRDVLLGFAGKNDNGRLLGRNLIVAFLPAAVIGLLLDDIIEAKLLGPKPVVIALAVGAFFMLATEAWRKKKHANTPCKDMHELSIKNALLIGFLQCVAMWPGTSRSMMTIAGGYFAGLSPARSAEFSFLLGLITLTAASGYKAVSEYETITSNMDPGPLLLGILVATVSAAVAVKWLVNYLSKHGLALFAYYRLILAIVISVILWA